MAKLLMLSGLPGSGKSSYALKLVEDSGWVSVRVNKDDIRKDLAKNGWKWNPENEKDVIQVRDSLIAAALASGHNVISDDTNFGRKHKTALEKLARENMAEFEYKFINTPIETCIERDAARPEGEKVGEKVIWDMYNRYLKPKVEQGADIVIESYTPILGTPKAIICDLDGTLALFKGKRSPYDASKCADDDLNKPVADILHAFDTRDDHIILLSGREDKFRDQTQDFLTKHGVLYDALLMRRSGDFRTDWIVKLEIFNNHVRNNYHVRFVLDDRDQVVKMWRNLGLTCLQVAEGNF